MNNQSSINSKELVIVTKHFGNGGAERVMSELIGAWLDKGLKITLVILRPELCNNDYWVDKRIEIVNVEPKSSFIRRIASVRVLVKLLKRKPDAVVLSLVTPAILITGLASFFVKNKVVFSERNDPQKTPRGWYRRWIRNIVFNFADKCVFQTEQAMRYFSNRIQKRGFIIKNPINPELPLPFAGKRRKCIVAVARLEEQKNLPMLINAFNFVHTDYPEYILEIYGRGKLEKELKLLIDSLGLSENIVLKGFSTDIYNKMNDCTMYVSSSNYEGISNSMLEALALGLPTICTDCPVGGAHEMIENNVSGMLIPVGDTVALSNAMKKVIEDKDFANNISRNSIIIRKKYDINLIADKWLEVLFS